MTPEINIPPYPVRLERYLVNYRRCKKIGHDFNDEGETGPTGVDSGWTPMCSRCCCDELGYLFVSQYGDPKWFGELALIL